MNYWPPPEEPAAPYRIVFRVIQDTVVIYTVLHSARHERHWQKRVGSL